MNLFTTTQALQVINASLQRPISRQAFHQSAAPTGRRTNDEHAIYDG